MGFNRDAPFVQSPDHVPRQSLIAPRGRRRVAVEPAGAEEQVRGKAVANEHRQGDLVHGFVAVVERQCQAPRRGGVEQRGEVDDGNVAIRKCLQQGAEAMRRIGQRASAIVDAVEGQHGAHDQGCPMGVVAASRDSTRAR